jgi:hypothetical protein
VNLLQQLLARSKDAIVGMWLKRTLEGHAATTLRFLLEEQDCFRNPVGNTLRQSLPKLFDALVFGCLPGEFKSDLDAIIRIRAVQDFSASQAVSFVFLLKEIVRQELKGAGQINPGDSSLTDFEDRVDRLALAAFDLFVQCREQLFEIKASEAGRRGYVRERMNKLVTNIGEAPRTMETTSKTKKKFT